MVLVVQNSNFYLQESYRCTTAELCLNTKWQIRPDHHYQAKEAEKALVQGYWLYSATYVKLAFRHRSPPIMRHSVSYARRISQKFPYPNGIIIANLRPRPVPTNSRCPSCIPCPLRPPFSNTIGAKFQTIVLDGQLKTKV